jgi:DNA mismatch repair protein MutL
MAPNNDLIEVLAQTVIEKIAAGEIIERPTSVLKELIENAIDADAAKIDIGIEDSGFACVKVSDNGRGMNPVNLQKSILRHTTSKIRSEEDLFSIGTMGFRGEALASIGAVSRMSIASNTGADGLGYCITCEGAQAGKLTPVSQVQGTTVTVRDLFFNVPARKKFLKTRKSERIALLHCIEQVSIPFPALHVTAIFEGVPVVELPPCDSIEQRICQIAGVRFAKGLIACTGGREGMDAIIHISAPEDARPKPRFQNLYVNNRKVESDQVIYAVREAFKQFTKSELRPSFFCFLNVDPARIDVNVHPTKLKVKFEDEKALFGFIFDSARRGIIGTRVERKDLLGATGALPSPHDSPEGGGPRVVEPFSSDSIVREDAFEPYEKEKSQAGFEEIQTVIPFPTSVVNEKKVLDPDVDTTIQLTESGQAESWNLISCYQIHTMFILAQIKNGIILIDQHAAHERILYEQALEHLKGGRPESQQLLFPIVIELSLSEKAVVQTGTGYFNALGFDITDFGGNAVSVSALPALIKDAQAENAVRETIRFLLEDRKETYLSDPVKRFAAAFACGAAIKAGQKLSQEEMNSLLNSLFGSENPYTCPHGRPTLFRMSLDELSRRFLR